MELGRSHRIALAITWIFGCVAAVYSVITPLFESPDELWHYPYVWHIAQTGTLPVQEPGQPQLWEHEGSQAPLYYLVAALLTAPIDSQDLPALLYRNPHADIGRVTSDGNINILVHTPREKWPWQGAVLAVHIARFFSVALATGTVWLIYLLGRLLYPQQPQFALLAMTFVAFNPMFVFIAGSVNNDNMITFTATLTLWQLLSLLAQPTARSIPVAKFLWLGFLTGLTALSKLSGLGMLGLALLGLLWLGWRQRSWRIVLLGSALVILMTGLTAGWWYGRNSWLYGDWSGTQTIVSIMAPRPFTPTLVQWSYEAAGLLRSFWGVFGYFALLLPTPVYWLLNGLLLSGLIGWLKMALSAQARNPVITPGLSPLWLVLLLWFGSIFMGLLWYTWLIPSSQGRLLFPAIAALALLWAAGWTVLVPSRWQFVHVLLLLPLTLWVPAGIIIPAYRAPAPISSLPTSAQPLAVSFGTVATLLGYEISHTTLTPGDELAVTLYWQSETPPSLDYSVFVQLVDATEQVVAQRDRFPGFGNYPTSQWQTGIRFRDPYVILLPRTTFAPNDTHLLVGLYNVQTGERLLTTQGEDALPLAQVHIQARPGPVPNPQNFGFADGIALVGYDVAQKQIDAGDTLELTLYWQAHQTPSQDYKVFVHLINDQAQKAAQQDEEPQAGAAPTTGWRAGTTILDRYQLQTDPQAPPGIYWIVVGLYRKDNGDLLSLLYNDQTPIQADSLRLVAIRLKPAE